MKISQEQKLETRQKLINTAADLFVIQGFDNTSMKQIARDAGIGDATIYKYFPNKDKLIVGFYEVRAEAALAEYHNTEDIDEYGLRERIQLLVDTLLEQLIGDREFVELSMKQFIKSPLILLRDELNAAKAYRQEFELILRHAEEQDGYPKIPLPEVLASLLTDFLFGIILFWMKDDSENFSHTTQLVDLKSNLIDSLLKSGVVNNALEVIGFLFKTQLLRAANSDGLFRLLDSFKDFSFDRLKNETAGNH